MTTLATTIMAVTVVLLLAAIGVSIYALRAENPNVEDVGFGLVIVAIVIGSAVALTASALD